VGAFLFILVAVMTPSDAYWAFGLYGAAILVLARMGGVPFGTLLKRMAIGLPFITFALFLPFIASGDKVDVLGLSLSEDGLMAAWNIIAKATIGIAVSVILASTTQMADLLRGFDRLHVPRIITGIAGFMIRYSDVITGEMRRMKVARESRGYDPRWLWQVRALASSAGTLFIRSFERGERVHLAMVSRGYNGSLPAMDQRAATAGEWFTALSLPFTAGLVLAVTLL
jgi:cobalt/nickel transport system permease protein